MSLPPARRVARAVFIVALLGLVFREVHVGVNFRTLGWTSRPPIVRWCDQHYDRTDVTLPAAEVAARKLHKVRTSPALHPILAAPKTGRSCPAEVLVQQADGTYLRYPRSR